MTNIATPSVEIFGFTRDQVLGFLQVTCLAVSDVYSVLSKAFCKNHRPEVWGHYLNAL